MELNKTFNSLDQLPTDVKKLPILAQQLWLTLFNSFESLGEDEDTSAGKAWTGVKQAWEFVEAEAVWKLKKILGDSMKTVTIINRTSDKGYFKTWIPFDYENGRLKIIEKDAINIIKDVDGKPVKRKYLTGVASNTVIDKENERVSPFFIKKMQETALGLNVFLEHEHTLNKTLGVISAAGGDENNFVAETMLEPEEDNENVVQLLKKAANGIKLGYSIGGRATSITKGTTEDGKDFIQLDDGDLFELSVTPMPAGNGTWITPIIKCMKEFVKEYEEHEAAGHDGGISKTIVTEDGVSEMAINFTELLTKNLGKEDFSKALAEMVQVDEIRDQMFDFWWAFREAIHFITFNEDLTPEQKGEKIKAYAEEFSAKIVELTSTMADLVETIDEAINS